MIIDLPQRHRGHRSKFNPPIWDMMPRNKPRGGVFQMKNAVKGAFAVLLLVLPVVLPITAASVAKVKPEEVGMSSERLLRIDQMLERRSAAGQLPGAGAIVARKGKIVHLTAKGVMDLESKLPVTPATMFRVASMTKPVTSVAVMMMIEEGKIRLNDPVSRYIPEFKGQKVAVAAPAARGETPAPAAGGGGGGGGRGGGRGRPWTERRTAELHHSRGRAGDHYQGSAHPCLRPRQWNPEQQHGPGDRAQAGRKAGRLHPTSGHHDPRVPARLALGLQRTGGTRHARQDRRDRLRHAAQRILPATNFLFPRTEGKHPLATPRTVG